MVLRSQMARQNIRWKYMSAGGKRRGSWRRMGWAVLSLIIVAGVSLAIWSGTSSAGDLAPSAVDPQAAGGEAAGPAGQGYQLPAPGVASGSHNTPATRPAPRPVPQERVWTLGGEKVEAEPIQPLPLPRNTPSMVTPPPATTAAPAAVVTPPSATRLNQTDGGTSAPGNNVSINPGSQLATGLSLIEQGKRVEGRKLLSRLLVDGALTQAEAQKVRDVLTVVNNMLIYSPRVTAGDPLTGVHVVERGDRLVNIAIRYKVPHQFIEKINGINADRIQLDQKIKVVNGPFHVVVNKSAYRMDVYLKDPADGQMTYIRSFAVGLGADDSTPVGDWVVRPRSKVINPGWTNPRTGETFSRDDPKNPIGEFWMGIEGVDANTATQQGFGIHGTIEQNSIGTQASMGCVRLRDEDIAQVFYMLWEGESTVKIVK